LDWGDPHFFGSVNYLVCLFQGNENNHVGSNDKTDLFGGDYYDASDTGKTCMHRIAFSQHSLTVLLAIGMNVHIKYRTVGDYLIVFEAY